MSTELAWAAGFFEGEGHIACHDRGKSRPGRLMLQCVVVQNQIEPLERFRQIVGFGRIRARTSGGDFDWHCNAANEVRFIYQLLKPYLSPWRREQFERALLAWDHRSNSRVYRERLLKVVGE